MEPRPHSCAQRGVDLTVLADHLVERVLAFHQPPAYLSHRRPTIRRDKRSNDRPGERIGVGGYDDSGSAIEQLGEADPLGCDHGDTSG